VVANLQKKQPANQENSGLKFVGRVGGVRKSVSIGPNRTKKTAYTVTSHAFTEFNNEIFYHPLAAVKGEQQNVISEWQRKLGLFIGNKITTDATGTGLESRHMIPPILDMALGRGIGMSIPGALEASPNTQIPCRIPASIAKILGVGSVPTPTYRDILEIIIGSKIQKPRNSVPQPITTPTEPKTSETDLEIKNKFVVSGTVDLNKEAAGDRLLGKFPLTFPTLDFKPVWNLATMYLNPVVNEAYLTLRRSNDESKPFIYPCFVARQKPFNTFAGYIALAKNKNYSKDTLLSLMQKITTWVLTDDIIYSYDVGSSDTTKINYIATGAVDQGSKSTPSPETRYVMGGTTWDQLDELRNGLRSFTQNVNCIASDVNGPIIWNKILTDYLTGLSLTYSGSISCVGISQPIAIGDNIELNDLIYHIESISHNCYRNPKGVGSFTTNMTLTNGMVSEQMLLEDTRNKQNEKTELTILGLRENQYPVSTSIDIKELDEGTVNIVRDGV
jgi:hypothetical protein